MNSLGINQYTLQRRAPSVILWSWFGALISIPIAWPIASMFVAGAASFRPCSINSSGLSVSACGKSAASTTDLFLLVMFFGAIALVLCAFTHAIRMTRKS
jgi:hypothetical protein